MKLDPPIRFKVTLTQQRNVPDDPRWAETIRALKQTGVNRAGITRYAPVNERRTLEFRYNVDPDLLRSVIALCQVPGMQAEIVKGPVDPFWNAPHLYR